jgi:endonuclease-8
VPEGHVVHRLAADHLALLGGGPVSVRSPQGRFPDAALVDGAELVATDAWGKHLFHEYEGDRIVHVHLGIYGKFTAHVAPAPVPPPRGTCRMRLAGERATVDLVGPTTCELLDAEGKAAVVARLGPDPLRPGADPERAWQALRRRRATIGQALLDQSVVAGVGNVYRAEVLLAHGIHPSRPAASISHDEFRALWKTLRASLRRGVREGRIATRDVYRQDTCRRCGGPVRRYDLAGRWAYACATCQT